MPIKVIVLLTIFLSSLVFNLPVFAKSTKKALKSNLVIGQDERQPSFDSKIGRMQRTNKGSNYCTGTMISKSCILTAGHCNIVARTIHFNIPFQDGRKGKASKEDIFPVATNSRFYKNDGPGRDWGVFRAKPNRFTKLYPGEKFGFYTPTFKKPYIGQKIKITGFGQSDNKYSHYQQSSTGEIHNINVENEHPFYIEHDVDTSSASSGSILFDTENNLIGMHTHSHLGKTINVATSIYGNSELMHAIKECIDSENR
jgi:V8-like Glu-specific endopeptidase